MNKYLYAFSCICFSILLIGNAQAQAPVANFSASSTSGCSPIIANFTDLSTNTPTSWFWDLGNGSTSTLQNPSTTYITPGTYTVILTATNANGSNTKTVTNYITVAPSPVVAFTADSTPACTIPKTYVFTNNSVPGGSGSPSYLWDFGDGTTSTAANPTKTYTTYGTYTVTLLVTNGNGCSKSLIKTNYIKINQKPTAAFTATNNIACTAPQSVSFTNNSTGAVSYEWAFGDGNTSTATNPSNTYTAAGTYTVRLIATNAGGCKDTISSNIVTIGKPTAAFNFSPSSACSGKNVTFTNTSSPAGYTSAWNFGNGGTSTQNNPTYSYATAGTYAVRLIATRNGCSDTTTQNITVNANPTVNFTASPTNGCAVPFNTSFSNTTTGASSYLWRFGNGNTSTATSPSHTYTSFGSYSVTLIATSSSGCTDSLVRSTYINIQPPTANITVGAYSGCAPVSVNFTANVTTTIPVSNYTWNFGDGSPTVSCSSCNTQSHTYTTSGTYTVTLTYTTGTGCTYNTTTTVTVATKPTANFTASPTTICPGSTVFFTNSSTGASSYLWLFGNGGSSTATNPAFNGYSMGTYNVSLIANNNGCLDTFTRNAYITVNPPDAFFTLATSCTNRFTITLTDGSVGANTYLWNFGDGNTSTQAGGTLTHTYSTAGNRTITLTVVNTANGCSSSYTRNVNIQPLVADFTISDSTICKGELTQFTATASSSAVVSHIWSFGDGNTFTAGAPGVNVFYAIAGTFSPKLVVVDANGCKDSITKTNAMRVGGPNVSFSASPVSGCIPLTTTFTDASTPNGGFAITNRMWSFGNGATQNTTNSSVSYTYPTSGNYSVKLVVTDANGCKDSLTRTNYIQVNKPTAQFYTNDTNICVGRTASFINTSTGTSLSSLWNFGNGGTSTATNPSYAYSTAGTYNVKLVVTDGAGCKDSITKNAYVKVASPAINFTMSDTFASCPPLLVNFTNTSVNVTNYTWIFGNGSQSTVTNPTTLYTYPGTYNVKLIGTGVSGCKDSITKTIIVNGPTGTFSYSPLAGCTPLTVSFSATSSNATSFIWDMSNGFTQTTTGTTFSYTYTQTGKYVPKLILSDGASCLVPIFGTDTVKVDRLDADFTFTPNNICNAGTVQFTDTVLTTLSPVTSRAWTFGDGGTSTIKNPSHTYTAPGNYIARLIITNAQGCKDTIQKTVTILAPPSVSATGSQAICLGTNTSVSLLATGAVNYSWSPTTGLSCVNCANPTASPTTTTTYIVTGTDANGCIDTGIVTVTVNNRPNVSASASPAVICNGASSTLTATGATTYVWTPVTSLSCSTCVSPTATPTATITYIVTGTDNNGCTDTGIVTITVNQKPTVTANAGQIICNGSSANLQANGASTYVWTPAATLSCSTCAAPVATPTTTTTYTVTGTHVNGCTNTATTTVTVNQLPNVSAGSNVAICNGNSTTLSASGASTYVWTPAATLSCSTCTNPIATPTTTTTYTVTGTDANGCTKSATVTVTVNSRPNVTASGTSVICEGSSTTLTANGASTYVWTPTTGLSCTTCTSPIATPTVNTTYIVTGTDANGCTDTGMITVTVNTRPNVNAGADTQICRGLSVGLLATGAATYQWSPGTGLSCSSCAAPNATPTATTTYSVIGIDANGCRDTDQVVVTVNALPLVSAGPYQTICAQTSATLNATGATTYVWSPATALSCTTCVNPVATPIATTKYIVTGTDNKGCKDTSSTLITVTPLPVVTATGSKTICEGDIAPLTASGANSYTWSPVTNLSCVTCSNPNATPVTTTTYTVTGTTNGCSATASVIITVLPKPILYPSPDAEICEGASAQLNVLGASRYVWTPATGLSCATCDNTTATPTTTTTYTITGTGSDGCTNTAQITVKVNPMPKVDAGQDVTICAGATASLNATGALNYVWSPTATLSCTNCANPEAKPAVRTTYFVTGSDNIGCSGTDSVTVTVIDKTAVSYGPGAAFCKGGSAQLFATGGTSYLWLPADAVDNNKSATVKVSPTVSTKYTVIVKQGDCFTDTGYINVTVHQPPSLELGQDITIVAGNSAKLNANASDIAKYEWSPAFGLSCDDCPQPTASPTVTTRYRLNVTDINGCTNTDDITVRVTCDNTQLFIANTFTPNNDGVNDRFYPQGKGITQVKSFRVYNRWGELVFAREDMRINDPLIGWDGTLKNTPLKPDVFVYVIQAFCDSGEPIKLKGDVSLIR